MNYSLIVAHFSWSQYWKTCKTLWTSGWIGVYRTCTRSLSQKKLLSISHVTWEMMNEVMTYKKRYMVCGIWLTRKSESQGATYGIEFNVPGTSNVPCKGVGSVSLAFGKRGFVNAGGSDEIRPKTVPSSGMIGDGLDRAWIRVNLKPE